MKLDEYILLSLSEILDFGKKWAKENEKDPKNWPMEMSEGDWGDQELAERFNHIPD